MSEPWTVWRAKVAGLSRDRAKDDPELLAARRELLGERLRLHIQRANSADPPLSLEQRADLASLLLAEAGEHRVVA